jgi:hypothetical protein
MATQEFQEKKKPRKKRRASKARPATIYYVIEIKDWDWGFTFGVSPIKDREGP